MTRRGPKKGAPNAGRPGLSAEERATITEALLVRFATVGSVARKTGHDRKTVRKVRDEEGVEPAKKGRRKVEK